MKIPLNVINRLKLGRSVAAQIEAHLPGHMSWVAVQPLTDVNKGQWKATAIGEGHLERFSPQDDPIIGYNVRHIEVSEAFGNPDNFDWHSDAITVDEKYQVASLDELETLLAQWMDDYSGLHPPGNVGYVFGMT